jgi:hypothetical protein
MDAEYQMALFLSGRPDDRAGGARARAYAWRMVESSAPESAISLTIVWSCRRTALTGGGAVLLRRLRMAGGFRHALAAARAEASSDEMVAGA